MLFSHRRILSLPALQQAALRFWFAKGYAYLIFISTLFDYSSSLLLVKSSEAEMDSRAAAATKKESLSRDRLLRNTIVDHIRADIRRLTDAEPTVCNRFGVIVFNPGLHAVILYRLAHWLSIHNVSALAVIVAYWNSVYTGAQISPRAVIG